MVAMNIYEAVHGISTDGQRVSHAMTRIYEDSVIRKQESEKKEKEEQRKTARLNYEWALTNARANILAEAETRREYRSHEYYSAWYAVVLGKLTGQSTLYAQRVIERFSLVSQRLVKMKTLAERDALRAYERGKTDIYPNR